MLSITKVFQWPLARGARQAHFSIDFQQITRLTWSLRLGNSRQLVCDSRRLPGMSEDVRSVNASILLVLILVGVVAGHLDEHPDWSLAAPSIPGVPWLLPAPGCSDLRLSDLQVSHWAYETYVLAIEAWLLWLAFPSLWIALRASATFSRPAVASHNDGNANQSSQASIART